ncbi:MULTISPECIES: hypothetical protein [Chromobacterium]|nr:MULTISPECIES: hypothetical protein [Chromobacterium]
MGKSLRIIILVTVTLYQLLAPVQSYAGVGQTLYPVILNAAINGGKMAGTVATRVIAGNPALGVAMTSNPAGDAQYDCMVAINPACLPLPDNWHRESDGTPAPSSVSPPIPTGGRVDNPNLIAQCKALGGFNVGTSYTVYEFSEWRWARPADVLVDVYSCMYLHTDGINYVKGSGVEVARTPTTDYTCPAGYTRDGASCNLFSPLNVLKPYGTPCSIIRDGSKFKTDSQNPACGNTTDGAIQMSNGTFSVVTDDNIKVYESMVAMRDKTPAANISLTSDGLTQVKSYDKATNTTTTTSIKDGKVVGTSTEAGNTTSNPPGTGAGTGTGTGGTPITCQQVGTCGVSQEATQQGVKTGIDKLVNLVTDMTKVDSSSPGKGDLPSNDTDFSILSGITMPSLSLDWLMKMFPDPECTDIQLDIPMMSSTNTMTIPVCKYLPPIRNAMTWFWYGVAALTIMGIFLGTKPEEDK